MLNTAGFVWSQLVPFPLGAAYGQLMVNAFEPLSEWFHL